MVAESIHPCREAVDGRERQDQQCDRLGIASHSRWATSHHGPGGHRHGAPRLRDAVGDAVGDSITVPRRFRARQDGVVIHHVDPADADRTRVRAAPVTTIARTLQEVAATSDPALLEQAVTEAIARGARCVVVRAAVGQGHPRMAPMVVGALAEE